MKRVLGLLLVAAACGQEPPQAQELASPLVRAPGFHDDARAPKLPPVHPQAGGTTVLFLNFGGQTLSFGSDDSLTNTSEISGTTVPAYDVPALAKYTRQQGIDVITDRVRTFYKPFNVQVVTTRPSSGDYTMVMVGGSHTIIPGEDQAAGVSLLDCDNTNPDNVCYDFSADLTPDYGGIPEIAIDASHESGHSFGLEHTDNPEDIMYSVSNPNPTLQDIFAARFTTGNYSSFNAGGGSVSRCPARGTALDNAALLTTALGANPAPGDTTAPTLDWTFPILPNVPTNITLQFTASDDTAVTRLEVYKNFELIAVLTQPPYQTTLTAADQESFYLTVEAVDAAANRTSLTKPFGVDANIPPLCPSGTCTGGNTCENGICRLPLGSACTLTVQCAKDLCRMPNGASSTICTQTCSSSHPCPSGYMCGNDDLCAVAVAPTLGSIGDSCSAGGDCESGRCQQVCVPACDTAPCADGYSCILVGGGQGCVPVTTPSPPPKKSSGCDLAQSAPPPSALVLVFALGLALAFRRRAGRVLP
jgi:Bacterial Ig domain